MMVMSCQSLLIASNDTLDVIGLSAENKPMPIYDQDFGKKLEVLEQAVGFRFQPSDFKNVFLARLLDTTPETMSRKKTGKRRVTESDWSRIADYFDLARFGFEASMFCEEFTQFAERMQEVGASAMNSTKPDKARQDLFDIATGPKGGKIVIERESTRLRGGGIGAEPTDARVIVLREGEAVLVRTNVPESGSMYLFNDSRDRKLTCLMPSKFAPDVTVPKGAVTVPNGGAEGLFPVGGPTGRYRLYAVWFSGRPELSINALMRDPGDPKDLDSDEIIQVAACAKQRLEGGEGVMAAIADYEVR